MVKNCCVVGYKNYIGKKPGLRFFRFPLSDADRCSKWEAAVRRQHWKPVKSTRICNEHFITGKICNFSDIARNNTIVLCSCIFMQ